MPYPHALHAGLGILGLTLGACTTAPPGPVPEDHPASIHAPAAPLQTEPSALSAYRDFGTVSSAPPPAGAPAMDHSMHMPSGPEGSRPTQDDPEGQHADHH